MVAAVARTQPQRRRGWEHSGEPEQVWHLTAAAATIRTRSCLGAAVSVAAAAPVSAAAAAPVPALVVPAAAAEEVAEQLPASDRTP